eukprot:gb/GECG01015307.1/.p1 GENE.gb/GECG01015307.1/~~gb/GECG01015307.1/.p1  ORF type:complete len:1553 (+),score=190.91 gb/GECG01015307.1/:1-4659(+)
MYRKGIPTFSFSLSSGIEGLMDNTASNTPQVPSQAAPGDRRAARGTTTSSSSGLMSVSSPSDEEEDADMDTEEEEEEERNFLEKPLPSSEKVVSGVLENGLRYVILPHFLPTNKVYANLHVAAGSLNEATEHEQGLAHFLEHSVFLGTEALPSPKDVENVLTNLSMDCHADSNAYTTFRETAFTMEAPAVISQEGLDSVKGNVQGTQENSTVDEICLPVPHHLRQHSSANSEDDSSSRSGHQEQYYSVELLLFLLHQLAFKARLSDTTALECEKYAVLSEAASSFNLDARLEFQSYVQLHGETPLPQRFPIGRVNHIKGFDSSLLQRFYKRWYQPKRMTLYLSGVLDPKHTEQVISRIFSPEKCTALDEFNQCPLDCEPLQRDRMANSQTTIVAGCHHSDILHLPGFGYPYAVPLQHCLETSPSQPVIVTQHPLISTFSFSLTWKHSLRDSQVSSFSQMKESVCDIILSQVLQSRLNELRSSVSRPAFRCVSWAGSQDADEGCTFSSLDITAESGVRMNEAIREGQKEETWATNRMRYSRGVDGAEEFTAELREEDWRVWQEAVSVGIRECVRLARHGVPELELETAIRAVTKAFRDRAAAADAVDSATMLDECIEAVQTSSSLMDRRAEYEAFQQVSNRISQEDINQRASAVFSFVEGAGTAARTAMERLEDPVYAEALDQLESQFHPFQTDNREVHGGNNSALGLGDSWAVVRNAESSEGMPTTYPSLSKAALGFDSLSKSVSAFISAPGPVARTNLQLDQNGSCLIPGIGPTGPIDPVALGFSTDGELEVVDKQALPAHTSGAFRLVGRHSKPVNQETEGLHEEMSLDRYGVGVFTDIRLYQVLNAMSTGLNYANALPDIRIPNVIVNEERLEHDLEAFRENATQLHSSCTPGELQSTRTNEIFVDAPFRYQGTCNAPVDWSKSITTEGLRLEIGTHVLSNGITVTTCPTPFEAGSIHVLAIARGGQCSEGSHGWMPADELARDRPHSFPPGSTELAVATLEDSGAAGLSNETLIRIVSGWGIHGEMEASMEEVVAHVQLSSVESDGPDKALQLIRAMLWHNHWDETAFNRAMDTTYLEATAVNKDLERKTTYSHMRTLFADDPRFVVANETQLLRLDKDTVCKAFEGLWVPNNLQILVIGDIDHASALNVTLKWLGSLPPRVKVPDRASETRIDKLPTLEEFNPPRTAVSAKRTLDRIDLAPVCSSDSPISGISISGSTCSIPDSSRRCVMLISFPSPGRYHDQYSGVQHNSDCVLGKSAIQENPLFPLRASVIWIAILERRMYEALRGRTGNCYSCSVSTSAFEFYSPGFGIIEATPLLHTVPQSIGDSIAVLGNLLNQHNPITEEECTAMRNALVEDLKCSQITNSYWIGQLQHLYCHGSLKTTEYMNQIANFYSCLTASDLNKAIVDFYSDFPRIPVHVTVGYSGSKHPITWTAVEDFTMSYMKYRYSWWGQFYLCACRVWRRLQVYSSACVKKLYNWVTGSGDEAVAADDDPVHSGWKVYIGDTPKSAYCSKRNVAGVGVCLGILMSTYLYRRLSACPVARTRI